MSTLHPALIALVLGGIVTPCLAQKIEERLRGCDSCHGEHGFPTDKTTPIIWGQQQGYIDSALSDFKKGLRVSEAMAASVQDLGRLDIVAISMHYAEKPWPDLQYNPTPSAIAQRAEHLISQGQCTASGCHVGFVGQSLRVLAWQVSLRNTCKRP